jgi:hypothetical protein
MSPKNKPNLHEAGTKQSSSCYPLHAGFFLGLFLDPEDEDDMFHRNVGELSMD